MNILCKLKPAFFLQDRIIVLCIDTIILEFSKVNLLYFNRLTVEDMLDATPSNSNNMSA